MYHKYFDKFGLVAMAGFLNPKTRDKVKLLYNDISQILKRIKFYSELWGCPVKLQQLINYSNVQPPFVFGNDDPLEEWCQLSMNEDDESIRNIYKFVLKIATISPSETYIERVFSMEGKIHTAERSKLGHDIVDDYMFLYVNKKIWKRLKGIK